jgi:hypothetical protein
MIFKRRFVLVLAAGMFALVAFICWQIGRVGVFKPGAQRTASAQLASP